MGDGILGEISIFVEYVDSLEDLVGGCRHLHILAQEDCFLTRFFIQPLNN